MQRTNHITITYFGACLAIGMAGCTGSSEPIAQINIPLVGDRCGVESARATISGAELPAFEFDLEVTDTSIVGSIPDVAVGIDRLVEVEALDGEDLVVYAGSTVIDVFPDEVVVASVVLTQDFDNCPPTTFPGDGDGTIVVVGDLESGPDVTLFTGPAFAFDFEEASIADDGVLYFRDAFVDRIRRFDTVTIQWRQALTGTGEATAFALAPSGDAAYFAYDGGRIDKFELPSGQRELLAVAPATVEAMTVAGEYLFTQADRDQALYDRLSGSRTDAFRPFDEAVRAVFAPGLSKVFFNERFGGDLHSVVIDQELGTFGARQRSPFDNLSRSGALRLVPDETAILAGTGSLFDTGDFSFLGAVGFPVDDIAFDDDLLLVITNAGDSTVLRILDADFDVVRERDFPGAARRIFVHGDNVYLVTSPGPGQVELRMFSAPSSAG